MGRAIDLFVTYRFLRLLTTPFEKTDAFKLGIIDKNGNRIKKPKSTDSEILKFIKRPDLPTGGEIIITPQKEKFGQDTNYSWSWL